MCWSGAGSEIPREKSRPGTSNGYFHDTRAGKAPSPEHMRLIHQVAGKLSASAGQAQQSRASCAKLLVAGVPREEHLTAVKKKSCKTAILYKK